MKLELVVSLECENREIVLLRFWGVWGKVGLSGFRWQSVSRVTARRGGRYESGRAS